MGSSGARVALVGDYNAEVIAHRGIERSLELARERHGLAIQGEWVASETIAPGDRGVLARFGGIWCVPASPYKNTDGVLWAIEYARTNGVAFFGTWGGFQHAILEYVRNVCGQKSAEHAELNPDTEFPLLQRMTCSLVEQAGKIVSTGSGRFEAMYGAKEGIEMFRCRFGLNPSFGHLFESGPMKITALSEEGEVRAVELESHPFFVATLFQPERTALEGNLHPLVRAFLAAAADAKR